MESTSNKNFVNVMQDFSQYLDSLTYWKKTNFLPFSDKSYALMDKWEDKDFYVPFLFAGPKIADVFIIDSKNSLFTGENGKLLIKILKSIKLCSDNVFICNSTDSKALHNKINIIKPKIIITFGEKAFFSLFDIQKPFEKIRGKFHEYKGIKVMPTLHPEKLLKHIELKRFVWMDMKAIEAYTRQTYDS